MILQPHAFDLPWDLWKYSTVEVTKATHKEETTMIHWSDLELQFISFIGIQVRPTDYGTVWIFNWYFWLVGLSVSYQYINTATWRCRVGYSLYDIRRISPCIFNGSVWTIFSTIFILSRITITTSRLKWREGVIQVPILTWEGATFIRCPLIWNGLWLIPYNNNNNNNNQHHNNNNQHHTIELILHMNHWLDMFGYSYIYKNLIFNPYPSEVYG